MENRSQFCTFYLNALLFGVDLKHVQEVIRASDVTRVPLAPEVVAGLINLRGQIVTVIDLRRRLNVESRPGCAHMYVVVRSVNGAVSLLVDEIGNIVEAAQNSFEPPPETLRGPIRSVILGVQKLDDRLMHVLDPEKACDIDLPAVLNCNHAINH